MSMNTIVTNYAVAPGEFIKEWLEEEGRSQASLAHDMGVSAKHVSKLINGAPLSPDMALKLELVTGIKAAIWNGYEVQFREDQARLGMLDALAQHSEVAKAFPVKQLRDAGFVTGTLHKPGLVLMQLMSFFGVADLAGLERQSQPLPAFRQDLAHKVDPVAVRTWLRLIQIELEASDAIQNEYDAKGLENLLPELRDLSRADGASFEPELVEKLANVGVRILFVPEIKGIRAHGCTQWFHGKPVITLTLRGKDDGKLWFTLFHEIGHVLMHPNHELMVQAEGAVESKREAEANEFASTTLVPLESREELDTLRTKADVKAFAKQLGISPGIVVGQLHHNGLWPHYQGRDLFKSFSFVDDDS